MRALAIAALTSVAALSACGETPAPAPKAEQEVEPSTPAVAADPRRFIGRWARSADQCESDWWRFWANEVLTKTEGLHCDILPPDASFSDTEIRTVCKTREAAVRETWTISYSDDGNAMNIKGEKDQDVNLVRCQ